ncbi:DUF4844 domain-containing protein [Mucilaginibacter aquatilis]|uniref:DUF4844 domain-containing protein n=1 Tax=Mucilaginibacter aquatilis TaxID=1517760 RepID=A0A6I4IEH4_9SPHI|nr:DUF4844 domain-containing protein [Mucilaginibacter aquatilis]MVN92026.1 DUF4844 domain-containing protein [Mucilaginibacter aquatilis]
MKAFLTLFLIASSYIACGQMKVNKDAQSKLKAFIKKSKFDAEPATSFNGLSHANLKPQFNSLLNAAPKDFLVTAVHQPTEEKFQQDIGKGLSRFNPFYLQLDSEDQDRICGYFEELMDCVGLQSSNGKLNEWRYGFNPSKKQ